MNASVLFIIAIAIYVIALGGITLWSLYRLIHLKKRERRKS